MKRFTLKHYFNGAVDGDGFQVAMDIIKYITDSSISIPEVTGYEFACYVNYTQSRVTDHNYYKSLNFIFDKNLEVLSFEVFARRENGSESWRVIGRAAEKSLALFNDTKVPYRFIAGNSKDLVIYFDYSRLVSKVEMNEEYIPRFGFKTNKNILVISNTFGHWGTGCLFDSTGKLIIPSILRLINETIDREGIQRTFFIGGSQGGVAALVYGGLIDNCTKIYSCVPVPISTKVMLKHLSHLLAPDDVWFASKLLENSFRLRNINLYSTIGDPIWEFHENLSSLGGASTHFYLCENPSVRHGDCLRHFIKEIYQNIELS